MPPDSNCIWNADSLLVLIDRDVAAMRREVELRALHTVELRRIELEAINKALAADQAKDLMHNGLIGAMKEQQITFLTKEQADEKFKSVLAASAAQFKALTIAIGAVVGLIASIGVVIGVVVLLGGSK